MTNQHMTKEQWKEFCLKLIESFEHVYCDGLALQRVAQTAPNAGREFLRWRNDPAVLAETEMFFGPLRAAVNTEEDQKLAQLLKAMPTKGPVM